MVRLAIGLGRFKAIKVLFGAVALTKMLCVLHLLLLTSQRRFSYPVYLQYALMLISFFVIRRPTPFLSFKR
jgi:hypothetical protein